MNRTIIDQQMVLMNQWRGLRPRAIPRGPSGLNDWLTSEPVHCQQAQNNRPLGLDHMGLYVADIGKRVSPVRPTLKSQNTLGNHNGATAPVEEFPAELKHQHRALAAYPTSR